ncbi:MAG TPA: hypothetical protein VGK52_05715 [Polyangia bacterium]|jgi:hypothetical protein
MSLRSWAFCALVTLAGCATSADSTEPAHKTKRHHAPPVEQTEDAGTAATSERVPAPPLPDASVDDAKEPVVVAAPPEPFGDVGFKEVNEKDWLAALREKIAQQEKVPPTDLRVSPGLLRAAYVRSPPVAPTKSRRRPPPRRHTIVVVDNQGRRLATFRALAARRGDEPPKGLRFLSEERLVYEVVEPPPEAAPLGKPAPRKPPARPAAHAKKAKPAPASAPARALPPWPPARTFVIQPIMPRARPTKCVGVHFTFTREHDHLAFLSGSPESGFVAVDGAQLYPRRGRAVLASAPAWSKDGHSLAFLESPADKPARLVLVAEIDNATGDTTWDLPPTASTDGVNVFWAGSGKLVVGKTQMRPIFSASFTKESPGR